MNLGLSYLRKRKFWRRYLIFLSVVLLANLIAGCYYYKVSTTYTPESIEIYELDDLGKQFIVHHSGVAFYVEEVSFSEDSVWIKPGSLYGTAGQDIAPIAPDSYKRYRKKKGDARLLNEVHLYVNEYDESKPENWSIPYSSIDRLDVYNHSTGHTVGYSILFGVAMIPVAYVAFVALFLLIMLLTGNSCPFIYTWNGTEYEFAGEIYSGAVYKPLERHDYLGLSSLVEEEGVYRMQISNELEEIQHTNLLELISYDHAQGQKVMVDKYGQAHVISGPQKPHKAVNESGLDLLPMLENKDDLIWLGNDPTEDPPLLERIELSFAVPQGQQQALLLLEAKNSYWLDFVYKNFRDMLGSSYKSWTKKQETGDAEQMTSWSLSQNIPLAVYIFRNGEWVLEDYFNTIGPMAMKEDVLMIDLEGCDPANVRIKLEAGAFFWEVGYVGLETTLIKAPEGQVLSLSEAVDENGNDVRASLLKDDALYYVQPEIGNLAELRFPAPPQHSGRTLVLHSKGFYEILSDPDGLPKIKALQEIRKPGNFNVYSNELMQIMLKEHLSTHGER